MLLRGSCHCDNVTFEVWSETPEPYNCCYCNLCTKTAGCGGHAVNIAAVRSTLKVTKGEEHIKTYAAKLTETQYGKISQQARVDAVYFLLPRPTSDGSAEKKSGNVRHFCSNCASFLYIINDNYAQWCYPFASAIDTPLPTPTIRHHLMLEYKRSWVAVPPASDNDRHFQHYPDIGIEDFHKKHGKFTPLEPK